MVRKRLYVLCVQFTEINAQFKSKRVSHEYSTQLPVSISRNMINESRQIDLNFSASSTCSKIIEKSIKRQFPVNFRARTSF